RGIHAPRHGDDDARFPFQARAYRRAPKEPQRGRSAVRDRQIIQQRQLVKPGGDLQRRLQGGLVQGQLGGRLGHVGVLDVGDEPLVKRVQRGLLALGVGQRGIGVAVLGGGGVEVGRDRRG